MDLNLCEHDSLGEMSKDYIIGIIIIVFISAFANAVGIGGGSVIVPVVTIMFSYEINEAIALSKATIFAGAVINVFFLLNERKEKKINESLIDYRLCSFMLPIMMFGTFLGVYLNFIVPPMIIILLLTGYLMLSIFSLHKKYKVLVAREDAKLGITLSQQISHALKKMFEKKVSERTVNDTDNINPIDREFNVKSSIDLDQGEKSNDTSIDHMTVIKEFKSIDLDKKIYPPTSTKDVSRADALTRDTMSTTNLVSKLAPKKITLSQMLSKNKIYIMMLCMSIAVVLTLSLLKEGIFFDGGEISRCSGLGIGVMVVIALFCMFVSTYGFKANVEYNTDNLRTEDTVANETEMSNQKSSLYQLGAVSFVSGIGAGLLGIGGGMIINPFLMVMNYSPMDAIGISSMAVLFTSTISTSEFLIMGAIKFSDINFFLLFAGIGSLSGVFIIKVLTQKFQRDSILLMIILGIFIFAVIVLPLFGVLSIPVSDYFKFGSVCL